MHAKLQLIGAGRQRDTDQTMAENGQRADGVSLTGITFDNELYGAADPASYQTSIGVADEDEQDEREQALRRCEAAPQAHPRAPCDTPCRRCMCPRFRVN